MTRIRQRYEKELVESVIPFWERHCVDSEFGGYYNFLDRNGSVFDTDKYMWMQWRIVYMFATLADTRFAGDKRGQWIDIASQGFRFLMKHGRDGNGWFYFALNREGRPIIAPYNIGSEFFAIMGCAALYKATGDEQCREAAMHTLESVLGRLQNPKGQWNKRLPAYPPRLSHEDRMAAVNLGLVLQECMPTPGLDSLVDEAVEMILNRFWSAEYGLILENINLDFSLDLKSCDGRLVCPGHGLESAWFILKYSEMRDRRDLVTKTCEAIQSILESAWDKENGGFFYFLDVLGKPPIELAWDMKLWWVHCEALVAALTGYAITGDQNLLEWFMRIDEWTWKHFPDPIHGEWYGYLNRQGTPTHYLKGGKWKTFFHLPRCLLECINRLEHIII